MKPTCHLAAPAALLAAAAGLLLVVAGGLAGGGCAKREKSPVTSTRGEESSTPSPAGRAAPAPYTGRKVCAGCHETQDRRWRGSDHDLAMQEAGEASILGDFGADSSSPPDNRTGDLDSPENAAAGGIPPGGVALEQPGSRAVFFRRDGGFWVRTEGAGGRPADYRIAYAFGVRPLQQYLVAFPGGRLQVLPWAWDTRPVAEGGGRWFRLYPGQSIQAGDPLFWTGRNQTWNHQCAACHSTALHKGYDAAGDRYETTWAEIDVACEACHGPGSRHVAWAKAREAGGTSETTRGPESTGGDGLTVRLADEPVARWVFGDGPTAHREPPRHRHTEIDTCAPCHSRRAALIQDPPPGTPFLQAYRPALLDEELYHADGQIREEVYVWGSFVQSKMYRAGVTCTDCHDPHGLEVRGEGSSRCAGCHDPAAFDRPEHHHHKPGSPGADCVACHMPARTYMVVDPRRDHGFRVPRPDLSRRLGIPNACTDCHTDHDAAWAQAAFREWYGEAALERPQFAGAVNAGRRGVAGAAKALASLARDASFPAIARATAVTLLRGPWIEDARRALREAAGEAPRDDALNRDDSDAALLRLAAARAAVGLDARARIEVLAPLLGDPVRAVRVEAAQSSAAVAAGLPPSARDTFRRALGEARAALGLHAGRADGHANLALLEMDLGDLDAARGELERALAMEPSLVSAAVNLAEVHRLRGDDAAGEAVLRQALRRSPAAAGLHHALGLLLVRGGRRDEARQHLERAAKLLPAEPRYALAFALALQAAGEGKHAIEVLRESASHPPADADVFQALAALLRDAGRTAEAREAARRWAQAFPGDPRAQAMIAGLGKRPPG